MTQAEALKYLEVWRWPDGRPVCPFCGAEAYVTASRTGTYRCKGKAHDFTVTNKTVFHAHKKTPQKCVEAIELVRQVPGISPIEFMRQTGWSYKGAWSFLERMKAA